MSTSTLGRRSVGHFFTVLVKHTKVQSFCFAFTSFIIVKQSTVIFSISKYFFRSRIFGVLEADIISCLKNFEVQILNVLIVKITTETLNIALARLITV